MRPPDPFSIPRIASDSNPLAERGEPAPMSSPTRRVSRRVREVLAHRPSIRIGHAGRARGDRRSRRPSAIGSIARPAPIEPRCYVTIRVGGALAGVVTLSETGGREVRVQASWGAQDSRESVSATHRTERDALAHANELLEVLVAGEDPRQRTAAPLAQPS
jgi:hypothetical protein